MPLATDRGKWENFWQILIAKYSLQILTTPNSERTVSSNPGVINILLFFKGCWFFFHNGNFTSEVVRLLVFIFIKNWIKSVHLEGKRFSHNFIPHKFEQIILLTFPWKVPHYYEAYEVSDAK